MPTDSGQPSLLVTTPAQPRDRQRDLRVLAEHALFSHSPSVGILINSSGEVLYIHGRTGAYLEFAPGRVDMSIFSLAREGLRRALTTAVHQAVVRKEPIYLPGLRVKTNGDFADINLTVRPAVPIGTGVVPSDLYLVVLEPLPRLVGEPTGNRIAPYRTLENVIEGAVITYVDITERKRAEEALRESRALAESIVAAIPNPLVVLDQELCVVSANPAFYQLFRVTPAETQGRLLYELGGDQWNIPALRKLLMDIRGQGTNIKDYEVSAEFARIGPRTMRLDANPLAPAAGQSGVILLAFADITGGALGVDAESTPNPLISQTHGEIGDQRPE